MTLDFWSLRGLVVLIPIDMSQIYECICKERSQNQLAVLIDPEKEDLSQLQFKIQQIHKSKLTHIFVGGSTDADNRTESVIKSIKAHTDLPVVLFPGDTNQITPVADALLFLSLISGRNPDYLIDKQVEAIPKLLESELEVIPTGYILIESGSTSAVERVSATKPLSRTAISTIVHTAKAGELLGMKLIYLEAGSGALTPIPTGIIRAVKNHLNIPLIVGGGIKTAQQLNAAYEAGADLVVIGTAFEKDTLFFNKIDSSQTLHTN